VAIIAVNTGLRLGELIGLQWDDCDLVSGVMQVRRSDWEGHLGLRGVSLKAIQELLGHGSMEMTLRYAHLSPDVRRDAVNALLVPRASGNLAAANQ
jgi:integrase